MAAAASPHPRFTVELAERSYDIVVGEGLLADAGRLIGAVLRRPRTVIIADERVAALYLETLSGALEAAGIEQQSILVPAGEATKSFAELERLLDRLLELQVERNDTLVALGGGVLGDLAGLAAGLLRRGTDIVQVPTSLLAQVDSSVGGKTAINSRRGKNLIGVFHQPRLVLADVGVLASLPPRELRAGYAEILKYGLLGDADFFNWLEANHADVLGGDGAAQAHAVLTCCRAKARFVAADEREGGERALLNLGHTFGHALEAEVGYGDALLHGEAVAIGMVMAFRLAADLGLCPGQDVERMRRHLALAGLATNPREAGLGGLTAASLLAHMRQDKKVRDGRPTFVLARGIGEAFLCREVEEEQVRAMLERELAA